MIKVMHVYGITSLFLTINSVLHSDVPIIATSNIAPYISYNEQYLVFSIQYYSYPQPVDVQWYKYNDELKNSSMYNVNRNKEMEVTLFFSGKTIQLCGDHDNLTIKSPSPGEYKVILKNTVGWVEKTLKWEPGNKLL